MAFVKRVSLVLMGCLISLSTGITVRETNDAALTGNALEIDDSSDILFSEDNSNPSTVRTNFKKVKQIALGYKCSAAITEDGCLYTWGINTRGQLGTGVTITERTPEKIMSGVKYVSLGYEHSAAITEDGSLYLWGANFYAQLGDGTRDERLTPVKIMGNVKSVSLGSSYSAAVSEDDCLYQWGRKIDAKRADIDESDETEGKYDVVINRTPLRTMENVKQVALGYNHKSINASGFNEENRCAFVNTNGDLYLWGDNSHGKLGNGEKSDLIVPVKVMSNIRAIALGYEHNAAIAEDGRLYLWGNNYCGQIGNNSRNDQLTPVKVMDNVRSVSLGDRHSAAITKDGSLYMWGDNYYGQLGNGQSGGDITSYDGGIESKTPIKIMENIKSVSLGYDHSAAITEDGELYVWGSNEYGQLGTSDENIVTYGYNSYATPGHEKTVCSNLPILISIPEDPPEESKPESMDVLTNISTMSESEQTDESSKKVKVGIGALGAAIVFAIWIRKKK